MKQVRRRQTFVRHLRRDLAIFLVTLALGFPAFGQEYTATQIIDKSVNNNTLGVKNAIMNVILTLTSKRGSTRQRQIEIRSMEIKKLNKTLVRFHAPADVAGTGFLRLDTEGGDDEQYLYLPALGKVKRISGSQRNQRFMGTDLTYADLESRELKDVNAKRLPDVELGGKLVYVIEAIPKNPDDKDVQYGKTISWIHKKSFVPLKTEFYDKNLRLLKKLTVRKLEKKSGNWIAMDSVVTNVQRKTKTRLQIQNIEFDVKLGANEFTQRALSGG